MTVGIVPNNGFGSPDGVWLQAVANGQNASYVSGIAAAGSSSQAAATQLLPGNTLVEVDMVGTNAGVALPPAIQGSEISIYNNTGSNACLVYPSIANNPITGVQDTINNGTSFSGGIGAHTCSFFFCAKSGVWAAK